MRVDLSPAAELALGKAAALAAQEERHAIGAGDLLRALLHEEEGQAAAILRAAGVSWDKLRALLPACDLQGETPADYGHTDEVSLALASARELARLHAADGTVTSDHLLLALLEEDLYSRSALEDIGLDFRALRQSIAPPAAPIAIDEPFDLAPAAEVIDAARILDASANRAREAMRVLEDYARFVRGDAHLSRHLKEMRHALAVATQTLPDGLLLRARDTVSDVGTAISTAHEQERESLQAVIVANAKRLGEALRSLEEYGKIFSPDFGRMMEKLRYESYTLEKILAGNSGRAARLARSRLYVLVTEALCRHSLLGTVQEALAGGADIVQLREKNISDRALLATARQLAEVTHAAGALLIVNDRPDIAALADADGVHLGQDDMPLHEARRIVGPDALIGVSTHSLDQLRAAVLQGADYLGVGPTFPSSTKDFAELAGLEFVRQASKETSLPAFVLGGVTAANISEVVAAGGKRVAVSGAVCAAENPKAEAAKLAAALQTNS